eukprot:5360204-Amphidinium_carterae.1
MPHMEALTQHNNLGKAHSLPGFGQEGTMGHASETSPTTPKPPQPSLGLGEIRAALVGKSSVPKPPPAKSS